MPAIPDTVPLRDERSNPIGLCEENTFLSSLAGLAFFLCLRPSVKTLGYCQAEKALFEIDFAHLLLHANYFDLVPHFITEPDSFRNRFEQNNRGG